VPDLAAASSALQPLGATAAGAAVSLDPARCHGVALHVIRAE
jgi:hypothetical protein